MEKIICAALYTNDGINHNHAITNKVIGFVICGRRHSDCIDIFNSFRAEHGCVPPRNSSDPRMGFLTTENRE